MDMAQFIDSALSDNGKVFVNCVFGRSRLKIIFRIVIFNITYFNMFIFNNTQVNILRCGLPDAETRLERAKSAHAHQGEEAHSGDNE